jgi:hypothetical protein
MRMDIKISPGALSEPGWPAARHDWGHACGFRAAGGGGIHGKCCCSHSHSAAIRGKRARRLEKERTMGVVWRHASVNLVMPRVSHSPRHEFFGKAPKIGKAVSTGTGMPQPWAPAAAAEKVDNFALTILA